MLKDMYIRFRSKKIFSKLNSEKFIEDFSLYLFLIHDFEIGEKNTYISVHQDKMKFANPFRVVQQNTYHIKTAKSLFYHFLSKELTPNEIENLFKTEFLIVISNFKLPAHKKMKALANWPKQITLPEKLLAA
jgi:hypothetical protein